MLNLNPPLIQFFSFRESFLHYIQRISKPKTKENLSKSCKFFYSVYPYNMFINDLFIDDLQNVDKNVFSMEIVRCESLEQLQNYSNNKIWLKNKLDLDLWDIPLDSISKVIIRCTAKIIRILPMISIKDFKLLTEEGTIEDLNVEEVIDSNGNPIPLEEIFICVPNARSIVVSNPNITFLTIDRLVLLNHNQKIESLDFYGVRMVFDLSKFFDFINKNAALEADISIMLSDDVDPSLAPNFYCEFSNKMESWKKNLN